MPDTVDLEVELSHAKGAPQLARWIMRSWCAGHIEPELLADVELIISELVTNAWLHGEGPITLRVCLNEDCLSVQVIDQGAGFEPQLDRDDAQIGRWGLKIVEGVSSRWGVHEGTGHVWFELRWSVSQHHPTQLTAPQG